MRWIERVITAHQNDVENRPDDRRAKVIALWEQYRTVGVSKSVVEMSLELAAQGNANEVELGFYVLMDLALNDASIHCHISELAKHKSATVRRNLAFYFSSEFPPEFSCSIFAALLRDKAASVRIKAIETIGMREWKMMLPDLHALRVHERAAKVVESMDYWIPLLETGYRVHPTHEPGCFNVTVLTGDGIASKDVQASSPNDPGIGVAIEELRALP